MILKHLGQSFSSSLLHVSGAPSIFFTCGDKLTLCSGIWFIPFSSPSDSVNCIIRGFVHMLHSVFQFLPGVDLGFGLRFHGDHRLPTKTGPVYFLSQKGTILFVLKGDCGQIDGYVGVEV